MKTVRDVCEYVANKIRYCPTIVETGCTYGQPANEDDTTTNNLAWLAGVGRGQLVSIDINPVHIGFAKSFIGGYCYNATFICGDSVDVLKGLSFSDGLDLLCLDSKEFDEDHMVNEYDAIESQFNEKHFVLVDDIHNGSSVKFKKMVPLLKELGYNSWREVPTPTGLFVAAKGYNLW